MEITKQEPEKKVLATLYLDPNKISGLKLKPEHFTTEEHGNVYDTIRQGYLNGLKKDDIREDVRKLGFTSSYFTEASMIDSDFLFSCDKVLKNYHYRELHRSLSESLQEIATSPRDIQEVTKKIQIKLLENQIENKETETPSQILKEIEKDQLEYYNKKAQGLTCLGIPTGFQFLDDAIDGLRPGHLWLIGGYTGTGKSTFMLQILKNILESSYKVSLYSLEMGGKDIITRILGMESGQNGQHLIKDVDDDFFHREYEKAAERINAYRLSIHTKKRDIEQIALSMTEEAEKGVDVFALDYAQNLDYGKKSEYEALTYAANVLQDVAKLTNKPIILLSQVNNESVKNKSEVMGYKGTGALPQVADLALELARTETQEELEEKKAYGNYNYEVMAKIRKNKHGITFNKLLDFDPVTGQYNETFPN
jgi:replicative DNA helicase